MSDDQRHADIAAELLVAERALADELAAVLERISVWDPEGDDEQGRVLARYREARQR